MKLPPLFRVRQRFPATRVANVGAAVAHELRDAGVPIAPGARIAIAVGSRGIANLPVIVAEAVTWVRARGGQPFVVPAMGSHAGATAAGQRLLLERLGIHGVAIESSMETVQFSTLAFMDKLAANADGTIVINRVKPHTSFHGTYESGLLKMIAVGLGKQAGAEAIHKHGTRGLRELMPVAAREILQRGNIRLGVAIVENAYDETLLVKAIPAARIVDDEPALLELARANMPKLPVEDLEMLIVDEIGKEISGTGMDTNVIGRLRIASEAEPASPRIQKIFVRDLVGGSAYGIGLADVTTRRLVAKADWHFTAVNAQTSGFPLRVVLPAIVEHDEDAVTGARMVRIKNTLRLDELIVSEPVRKEIEGRDTVEVLGPANLWDAL